MARVPSLPQQPSELPATLDDWAAHVEIASNLGPPVATLLRDMEHHPHRYPALAQQIIRAVLCDGERSALLYHWPEPLPPALQDSESHRPLVQLVRYVQNLRAQYALAYWRRAGLPVHAFPDHKLAEAFDNLRAVYRASQSDAWPSVPDTVLIEAVAHNPFWLAQGYQFSMHPPSIHLAPEPVGVFYARLVAAAEAMGVDDPPRADEAAVILGMIDQMRRGHSRVTVRNPRSARWPAFVARHLRDLYHTAGRSYDPDAAYAAVLRLTACPDAPPLDPDDTESPWTPDTLTWAKLFQLTIWPTPAVQRELALAHVPPGTREQVSLLALFWAEHHTIQMLEALLERPVYPLPDSWDAALAELQARHPETPLTPVQRHALTRLWTQPISLLLGPAGSGKTTLIGRFHELVQILQAHGVVSGAPTGKAAQRLTQSLRSIDADAPEARTIHRMAHIYSAFGHARSRWLADRLADGQPVIIDESSMLDVLLLHGLLHSLTRWIAQPDPHAAPPRIPDVAPHRVIFVADPVQLPPVNPGGLGDWIAALAYVFDRLGHTPLTASADPRILLAGNYRQGSDSSLHQWLAQVRQAALVPPAQRQPLTFPADEQLQYLRVGGQTVEDQHTAWLNLLYLLWQPDEPAQLLFGSTGDRAQLPPQVLLTPTRLMAYFLSAIVRQRYGRTDPTRPFVPGDLIINKVNDYATGTMNGTLGRILEIREDPTDHHVTKVVGQFVQYRPDGPRWLEPWTLPIDQAVARWRWGYALTAHEAQGSEWPAAYVAFLSRDAWQRLLPFWRERYQTPWTHQNDLVALPVLMDPWEAADEDPDTPDPADDPDALPKLLGVHNLRWAYTAMSRSRNQLGILSDLALETWLQTLEALPDPHPDSRLYTWGIYRAKAQSKPPSPIF